jgi:hypothetical protein
MKKIRANSIRRLRVAIIMPDNKFFYFAGSIWMQRYGPLQVASVASRAGYDVSLFNEELGVRSSPERLARDFDVIGFSCKSSAVTRAEELAGAVRNEAKRLGRTVVTVLGGEHISLGGDSRYLPHFDYILRQASTTFFLRTPRRPSRSTENLTGSSRSSPGVPFK